METISKVTATRTITVTRDVGLPTERVEVYTSEEETTDKSLIQQLVEAAKQFKLNKG